ncbi:endonuclease/exonuclease/phosphatase family protein [Pontibacter cellulosilyticus]|uniref:Endonuclease/exonuclease/phosphatase family protein n=1 Tax=Pontibacter cellulosilyticus TaxID=1720253 RepID=A0A923N5M5_9BACT|nr:endonuclease/exonuclease/phosphatase family protein [Pontibacter cellulosilyticus]MBC5992279.1 endonuclease/exonuclease/phosphatase family protein [Pontibacter cellulosilyticus]
MKTAKKVTFYLTLILGTLLILATLLSLLYNLPYWYIKMLDFPREQMLAGLLLCIILFVPVNNKWNFSAVAFAVGLVSAIAIQSTFILPYTSLTDKAVASAKPSAQLADRTFSILIANIWMENRQAKRFLQLVQQADPDLVLAMETDEWWVDQLSPLQQKYTHVVSYPLDNTYGMVLYSKLPLKETDIMFLKHETVPSIHTNVVLPNGEEFILHAMHPVPPKPSKHPDNVGEEEEALLKVGRMVSQSEIPSVVAGDFNDVAWSRTSRMFNTQSQLHDVRVGRGTYNSFGANNILLRYPLDHVYVSEEFQVQVLKRLPKFGSDHFPILVKLSLVK